MTASGEAGDSFEGSEGLIPEGDDIAMATLCTEEITLRTYCLAIEATFSCKLLSNGNWKAIVRIDRAL